MSRLEAILSQTREAVRRRKEATPLEQLAESAVSRGSERSFAEALSAPGMSLIAEHKRRSPSAGAIREDLTLDEVVTAYETAGAAALSVLTEEANFRGSLDDLAQAKSVAGLPVLRKDFIVDPYQVHEARAWGADAILLIVAALHPDDLIELGQEARGLDLDVLVEVHDHDELEVALDTGAELIGINNRNLADFTVDLQRTFDLLSDVPAGKTVVAESGISTREQVESLEEVGVDAVLVGESLMRSTDLEIAVRELLDRT